MLTVTTRMHVDSPSITLIYNTKPDTICNIQIVFYGFEEFYYYY